MGTTIAFFGGFFIGVIMALLITSVIKLEREHNLLMKELNEGGVINGKEKNEY